MLDELDDGPRIGVWTALGIVALLLFGLLGGLAIRGIGDKPAAAAAAAASADALLDVPLSGDIAGTLYFESGVSALGADAGATIAAIKAAADAAPARRLLVSGFHDSTGDAVRNAQLAKERAQGVRAALAAAGVDAARVALRKPESTTGDGSNAEARRVEVRLLP